MSSLNSLVTFVKTNKPTLSETNKLEISLKDRQLLTIASDYLKLVKDPKLITIKSFFLSKSINNKDKNKQKENNNQEGLKKNVNMTKCKEDTCKLIAPNLMILSLEQKLQAGRTLELIFALKTKGDAEPFVREMEWNFVLMILSF